MGVRDGRQINNASCRRAGPVKPRLPPASTWEPRRKHFCTVRYKISLTSPPESPAVLLVGPRTHPQSYTLFTGTDPRKFLREGPLLHFPMIELEPVSLSEQVDILRSRLRTLEEGLIFPSSRASHLSGGGAVGTRSTTAGRQKLLAVGPMTAKALRTYGLKADAAPTGFGGAAALAALEGEWQGSYGYLTSDQSPVEERQQAVRSAGIDLDPAIFYRNRTLRHDHLPALPFHRVLFTSGSTVNAYFDQFPEEQHAPREWIAVGTSTLDILHERGLDGRTPYDHIHDFRWTPGQTGFCHFT